MSNIGGGGGGHKSNKQFPEKKEFVQSFTILNVVIFITLIVQSMINLSEIRYTDLFKQDNAASECSFFLYITR